MSPQAMYRRSRIEEFVNRLKARRFTLLAQIDQPEYKDLQLLIKGQLQALDMVIGEMQNEFEIEEGGNA